jgi:hypothetical protein
MSDRECDFIIGQAEDAIRAIDAAAPAGANVCPAHPAVVRVGKLTLQMLIPLYRKVENGGGEGLRSLIGKTPLTILWGTFPPAVLGFLWLVGKGKGWW